MVITSSSAGRYRSRDADYPNIPNAARVFWKGRTNRKTTPNNCSRSIAWTSA
jgi:hypothetical protein